MIFFANSLLDSICEAFLEGPKIFRLFIINISTIPKANGVSDPTIVKSILFSLAKVASSTISVIWIFTFVAKGDVPALPGATYILRFSLFVLRIAHAIACSLPPDPTTRTFIYSHSIVPGGLLVMS